MALVLLNLLIDPIGGYSGIALRVFQPYRGQLTSRAAKAELIARGECDILLLGSSRVVVGCPVNLPVYGSNRVCNLGLNGTTLTETSGVLDFALRHNRLKRVLLGADFLMFSDVRSASASFENSRFNPKLDLFEYHLKNLLGSQNTSQSWLLLRQALRKQAPKPGERGFVPKAIPRGQSQRDIFAARIRDLLADPETYGGFRYSQERLDVFRQMVRRCRQENVELIVFIPPVHALDLETIRAAGLWPTFERWKSDLTHILGEESAATPIPLWDFTGYDGKVAEDVPPAGNAATRMKWYLESSHFTPALGELVIERLLGNNEESAGAPFGVRVTAANLESHLSYLRTARQAYAARHPDEITWVEEIAASVKGKLAPKVSEF
jgi:hypothetical protein